MPAPPLRNRTAALLISGVVLFKLVYLLQYSRLPFLRGPIFDSVVYLQQARAVLSGRFGDATLLAMSPLYGYALALLHGDQLIGPPILAQLALGTLNLCLIYRFLRTRAGHAAALISAGLYLGYGLLLSYESKILTETLALSLALGASLLYLSPAFAAGRLRAALTCGALAGLSVLARASLIFVPFFLVVLALLPFARGEARGPRLRRTLAVTLGLGLVLGGNGLWNLRNTGLFVPVILVSKTVERTTAKGFDDDFNALSQAQGGMANAWDVVNQAQERLQAARSGAAAPRTEPPRPLWGVDLLGWLSGAPIKLLHTFTDYEVTYDYGYFGERSEVAALAALPVSFQTILLLGGLGAVLLVRREGLPALVPYLPYLLGVLVTTTLFHSSSRYRLAMVLPLLLLAGPGVVALLSLQRRWAALLAIPVVALCALLMHRTLTYQMMAPAQWELRVAQSCAAAGDRAELQRRLRRAKDLAPQSPEVTQRIQYFAAAGGVASP